MLVFTRKEGEEIQIGEDIRITVVRIEGVGVRVGIEAPRSAAVWRGELHDGKARSAPQRDASGSQRTP